MIQHDGDSSRFRKLQQHLFAPPRMISSIFLGVLLTLPSATFPATSATEFYQRYPAYHPYCSDPKEMTTRAIPPLPDDAHLRYLQAAGGGNSTNSATETPTNSNSPSSSSRLVHVTAIIRHGARTITHPKPCWNGYWDGPEGVWDCDLKTLLTTRPYSYPNGNGTDNNNAFYITQKVYDAFQGDGVDSPYKNNLNGTCQVGQLIQQGYDQQVTNGRLLREAYIYDGSGDSNTQQDPRMRLFDTTSSSDATTPPWSPQHLRFRSDDEQRTLASGQISLTKMFQPELNAFQKSTGSNPIIPHHMADFPLDVMSPKYECSSAQQAAQEALDSQEYHDFWNSQESSTMRQMLQEEMGLADATSGLKDCIMTAMCTDRALPPVLDDYGRDNGNNDKFTKLYGPNRFERLTNYLIQNDTITNRYNDAKWSKLVMGPMWAEILDHLKPVIDGTRSDALRFALYSGHDSTIKSLMPSLSPNLWNTTNFPWYASTMLIEIHEVSSEESASPSYAFRLVYNGQVLTWLLDGCPEFSHLCDVSILVDRVSQFATRKNGGCGEGERQSDDNQATTTEGPASKRNNLLWSVEEADIEHPETFLIVAMVLSFVIGSLSTCCVVRCCWNRPRRRLRNQSELVNGSEETSSDFMVEEPDIVID